MFSVTLLFLFVISFYFFVVYAGFSGFSGLATIFFGLCDFFGSVAFIYLYDGTDDYDEDDDFSDEV